MRPVRVLLVTVFLAASLVVLVWSPASAVHGSKEVAGIWRRESSVRQRSGRPVVVTE